MSVEPPPANGRERTRSNVGPWTTGSERLVAARRPWRARSRSRKATVLLRAAIGAGVILFLVISGLLARYLSAENAERNSELMFLQAQARGDVAAMLAQLPGCGRSASCAATVRTDAVRLRRPGAVKILSVKSPTAGSLTGATGVSRVAWTVIGKLPVVQCFRLRRSGNPVAGIHIALLSVSAPIANEADC